MTSLKRKSAYAAAGLAAATALAAIGFAGSPPAGADPKQLDKDAFIVVGSDSTQEIMNAFAGFNNGVAYTPLTSGPGPAGFEATGYKQLVSFDATGPTITGDPGALNTCIEPGTGAPQMYRPNGSGSGRRALSRSFTGTGGGFGIATACGGVKPINGLVDVARSSDGPASGTPDLTYIPFARDALAPAVYRSAGGAASTNFTTAQLTALFNVGPQVIGGIPTFGCGIQTGSGTNSFWLTANGITGTGGVTPGHNPTGTDPGCGDVNTASDNDGNGFTIQENKADQLKDKGDLLNNGTFSHPVCDGIAGGPPEPCTNAQVVVGFSAAAYVAAYNGQSFAATPAGVRLASINGNPAITGAAPSLAPVVAYYQSGTFGRDLYNVLPSTVVADTDNTAVQNMFVGNGSAVCSPAAESLLPSFGLISLLNASPTSTDTCGSTTLRGPFISGNS
jgi:hypothetical protein